MGWLRLSDCFAEHPKLLRAGPVAGWLHVKALCYCNRQLTDGKLPRAAVAALVQQTCSKGLTERGKPITMSLLTRRLVACGLWEKDGPDYRIHDYLQYQPSRREVEIRQSQIHQVRVRAGAAGGQQTSSKRAATVAANVQPQPNPITTQPNIEDHPPVVPPRGDSTKAGEPRRHRPMNDPETTARIRGVVRMRTQEASESLTDRKGAGDAAED